MRFGIIKKKCENCGREFETSDDRVNYCEDCYLDEFKLLEDLGGGYHEKQAKHRGAV